MWRGKARLFTIESCDAVQLRGRSLQLWCTNLALDSRAAHGAWPGDSRRGAMTEEPTVFPGQVARVTSNCTGKECQHIQYENGEESNERDDGEALVEVANSGLSCCGGGRRHVKEWLVVCW